MKKILKALGWLLLGAFVVGVVSLPLLFTPIGLPYLLSFLTQAGSVGQNAYGINGVMVPVPMSPGLTTTIERHTHFETGTSYDAVSATTTMPDGSKGRWELYVYINENSEADKKAQAQDTAWFALPVLVGYPTIADRNALYLFLFSRKGTGKAEFHDALLVSQCASLYDPGGVEGYFGSKNAYYLGSGNEMLAYYNSFLPPDCSVRKPGKAGSGAVSGPWILVFHRDGDRLIEDTRRDPLQP